MKILLWIGQVLLAVAFAVSGFTKAFTSQAELAESMAWVESFPAFAVTAIGVAELAGAVGLILPALTGVLEILTPLAAVGLALTMLGAVILHMSHADWGIAAIPAVLGVLSAVVAWGRFRLLRAGQIVSPKNAAT